MLFVNQLTLTSSLGAGLANMRQALTCDRSGLVDDPWPDCDVPCFLGIVNIPDSISVPDQRLSRNNRLVEYALQQDEFAAHVTACIERYGAERVGLVMGTSTSSIDRTEAAYRAMADMSTTGGTEVFPEEYLQPRTHNPHAPGDYAAERLGLAGPCMTVSAACASSARCLPLHSVGYNRISSMRWWSAAPTPCVERHLRIPLFAIGVRRTLPSVLPGPQRYQPG